MANNQYINAEGKLQDIVIGLDVINDRDNIYRNITAKFDSPCEYSSMDELEPIFREVMCDGVKAGDKVIFHIQHHNVVTDERDLRTAYHVDCLYTWRAALIATTLADMEDTDSFPNEEARIRWTGKS